MEGGHNQPSAPPPDGTVFRPTLNSTTDRATPLAPVLPACDKISINYDITTAIICAACFVFGILYCFFGYRFFKVTLFMTGFIFGSLVTYLICLEEQLLPWQGKIGVAMAAGVLCGLITMLVQYVGVFMTGFQLGLLLGIASLTIMEEFYHPSTKWICIGVLFGGGLLFALLSLKFQRGLTIFGTSIFGSAMLVAAIDYYIEMFMMVNYVWDRVKAEYSDPICWFSWIILGLWPATFLVGALAQWKVTGRGVAHKEGGWQAFRKGQKRFEVKPSASTAESQSTAEEATHQAAQAFIPAVQSKRQKLDLQKARKRDEVQDTQFSRYRHLYQVRRVNGDVIAQNPKNQSEVP